MKKIREIKRWGNTCVIILNTTDLKDMELKEGDNVDISDLIKFGDKEDGRRKQGN
tara:strand:- start:260 stop:424 length:165 start_codon:yes stop_codon:yes gene_type:complete